jgi:Family of unknown function (DUF6098)
VELPTIDSLGTVVELIRSRSDLFVRWSAGPEADLRQHKSVDDLTRQELAGLSANSLAVEPWWDGPDDLWVARRIYDYLHIRQRRPADVRPWILEGEEVGRGPDNEPLVQCRRPVAWIDDAVVDESVRLIRAEPGEWGPLDRQAADGTS